jgi:hypothetical protein
MSNLLRDHWWKRILAGDTTAVPAEWLTESGSLKLAGEQAREFIEILEEEKVELSPELAEACAQYVVGYVIQKTGEHPNGTSREDWDETYKG